MIIRGIEDPVFLLEEEGKAIEKLLADDEKNGNSIFQIEGVWTGRKSDIKALFWEREARKAETTPEVILTPEEQETERIRTAELFKKYRPDFLKPKEL